jgi:hypothetical protein
LPQGIVPAIEKWFANREKPGLSKPAQAKVQDAP